MDYVHPACAAGRKIVGPIDVGAYEVGGEVAAPPDVILPERCAAAIEMVSGADLAPGALSPGSYAAINGQGFADAELPAPGVPLPSTLGGVTVRINGQAAPLYSVGPRRVDLQVPWETQPGSATVAVTAKNGVRTAPALRILPAAPRLFVSADGRGIIQNEDAGINSQGNPAAPGLIGVAQANVRVPDLAPGDYPVVVIVNNVESNAALISVGPRPEPPQ